MNRIEQIRASIANIKKYSIIIGYPAGTMIAVLLIWETIVWAFEFPEYFLPGPFVILQELFSVGFDLVPDALLTIQETILGFILAIIVGFSAALAIAWSGHIKRAVLPLFIFLQTMPKIAIAPIFIIWFGFGPMPKIIMSFLICLFPILINTSVGLVSVETAMLELVKSMAATKKQIFLKVRIPNALPIFFTSLKIAITLALIGALVGEFVGGEGGLGYQILLANARLDAPRLFSIVIILMLIGAGLFYLISGLERVILPWKPAEDEVGTTITGVPQ